MATSDHGSWRPLDSVRQQKSSARLVLKLDELLSQRTRLSMTVGEMVSHNLPGADDKIIELLSIEELIEEHWPAVWEDLAFADWAYEDLAAIHHPETPSLTCRVCTGVSAQPPPQSSGPVTVRPILRPSTEAA